MTSSPACACFANADWRAVPECSVTIRDRVTAPAAFGPTLRTSGVVETASPSAADWDDIRAAVGGDGDAYGRLVDRYQQGIARYLWRFTRDPQIHEELVQTVFVDAYFQLGRFAGRSPLIHWLQVIATRVGYRFWKSQSRQRGRGIIGLEAVGEPVGRDDAAETFEAAEAAARVHACLDRLPPRDRLVITLLHLEEKSVAEIAGLTGWSQTMVKVQAFRARGKLARLLKESPL